MSTAVPVAKQVMVLGNTPEAARLAEELLALDYGVDWLWLADDPPARTLTHPRLFVFPGASLSALSGFAGDFAVRLGPSGRDPLIRREAALAVALGNERYFPADRYPLALGPRVLTSGQLAEALAAPLEPALAARRRRERWLLLLDWDGETAREIEVEVLGLAARLRGIWRAEVAVFYQNLTVDVPGLERMTRAMRAQGIVFCRYGEAQLAADDDGVTVTYQEGPVPGDWLVLPEAIRPRADARQLAAALKVRLGRDGYFGALNVRHYRPGLSSRRGVFMAGRCHMDCSVADAVADAVEVAGSIDAMFGSGYLVPEEVVARVDPEKCVRCLTCLRTCPHAAIEMIDYDAETTAAHVAEMACYGCGGCVANCPAQAISLSTAGLPAWMQES